MVWCYKYFGMRNAIAFCACAAYAWLPATPLHCTRAPALRATSDAAEDESIGRRRFVEVLDIEPRQPSAAEAPDRDPSFQALRGHVRR